MAAGEAALRGPQLKREVIAENQLEEDKCREAMSLLRERAVETVESFKYLGTKIDDKLWYPNVYIVRKITIQNNILDTLLLSASSANTNQMFFVLGVA